METSVRKMAFWGEEHALKLYVRSCGDFTLVPGDPELERNVDFGEIFWPVSGSGKFFLNNKFYTVKPGQVWYYPPGALHKYHPFELFHYCWLCVAGEYAKTFFQLCSLVPGINPAGNCPVHLFTSLGNDLQVHTAMHRVNALNTAFQILSQIPLGKHFSARPEKSMSEVRKLIESSFADPDLSVERLAENLNMHRGSLSRSFSKAYGTSISSYIIHTRLQAAMSMLKNTSLSVGEIAENCGFSSGNYFAKVFSAKTSHTPKEFRAKYKTE
ncbi:MAG: helix-turn-helix transcriptional regulator [Lentisphaeria bacterium]|nr:helix-turn-helix transcriptional regulator [Lentisphaeria bacterium]